MERVRSSRINIQTPSGIQVLLKDTGMDMKEKKSLSLMNSKDGSLTQSSRNLLETATNSESTSSMEQDPSLQRRSLSSPTMILNSGGKKSTPFVLSAEDFQKYYTLSPVTKPLQQNEKNSKSESMNTKIMNMPGTSGEETQQSLISDFCLGDEHCDCLECEERRIEEMSDWEFESDEF